MRTANRQGEATTNDEGPLVRAVGVVGAVAVGWTAAIVAARGRLGVFPAVRLKFSAAAISVSPTLLL